MAMAHRIGKQDRLFGGETWTVVAIEDVPDDQTVPHFDFGQRIRLEWRGNRIEMSTDHPEWDRMEGIPLEGGPDTESEPREFTFRIDIHGKPHVYRLRENPLALGRGIQIRSLHEHSGTVHLNN